MANGTKTYDYAALSQAEADIKNTVERIRESANELIRDAQNLQERGWQGQSATGYNQSAEKLMRSLNGFGSYLEQQKANLAQGASGMQDLDSRGGKRMSAFS